MRKIISIILFISFILCSLASCNKGGSNQYKVQTKEISFTYFNTVSIISEYGGASKETFESYVKTANELLKKYHRLFDIYYEYSGVNNLCTINKNAGISAVEVTQELIVFLEYCKQLYTLTNGKTNVMLGSVLSIWHDHRTSASNDPTSASVPDTEILTAASSHTSIDSLVIDKEAGTVYISDPDASIDVGAIGKGYAVQRLYETLKNMGADSVALNIGGNLRTIGTKPGDEPWITGITNPDLASTESFMCRVKMGDTSLVTSGDYERYYYVGDVRYHHIIDPDTLMPAAYFASVSIFTADSGLADALSTALFCMSYEDGLALIESIGGIDVIWIDTEYNVRMTDGVKTVG